MRHIPYFPVKNLILLYQIIMTSMVRFLLKLVYRAMPEISRMTTKMEEATGMITEKTNIIK